MNISIKTKILVFMLIVAFIPGLAGVLSTYFKGSEVFRDNMGEKFSQLARQTAFTLDTLLKKEVSESQLMSTNPYIVDLFNENIFKKGTGSSANESRAYMYAAYRERKKGFLSINLYNNKGETIFTSPTYKTAKPIESGLLEIIRENEGKTTLGTLFKSASGSSLYPIYSPVYRPTQTEFQGVLETQLDIKNLFKQEFNQLFVGETGHVNVVFSDGSVLYDPLIEGDIEPFSSDIMNKVRARGMSWFIGDDEHNMESIIAFSPLKYYTDEKIASEDKPELYVIVTQTTEEALDKPIRDVLSSTAVSGFILASFLIFIIYSTLKKIIQPITILKEGVSIIGSGNLNHQIEIHTGDEIEELALEFNTMASELKELYSGLEQKVRERTLELEESNRELQKANRLKSEFLANMSHELRTPLNSIIGFSEVLYDDLYGETNERQKKYLDNIHRSGNHLLELINATLNLSKIEAGRMDLALSSFPLDIAVTEVQNTIKPLAAKKKIDLSVSIEKGVEDIVADRLKLKQILYNLIGNAIKFTPEGGAVSLKVRKLEDTFEFSVKDTGVGIEENDLNIIFESFRQVDGSHTRDYEGTGLGLTLTKKFVEMHNGRIWVKSKIGKGSTFFFTITLQQALLEGWKNSPPHTVKPPTYSVPHKNISTNQGQNKLVLVVEDNEDASHLISMYLKEGGYDVAKAFNGEDALKLAEELKPFAITLDIMLPKKDGWEVLNNLKTNDQTVDIPVVIISMVDNRELGYALGALDTCTKPISKNDLLRILGRHAFTTKVKTGKVTVLIVDDDPQCLDLLSSMLEPLGFTVIKASGGNKAIELAKANNPDLMILDLMMPEVSGFDVVHEMKRNAKTREVPIMILTAKEITEEDKKVLNGHIERIIGKATFSKELLLKEMKSMEKRTPID